MLLIGSCVCIDWLNGIRSLHRKTGCTTGALSLTVFDMLGQKNALVAVQNYRFLSKKGITIRKVINFMTATFCIENNHPLFFWDKDLQPFVEHLGLGVVNV